MYRYGLQVKLHTVRSQCDDIYIPAQVCFPGSLGPSSHQINRPRADSSQTSPLPCRSNSQSSYLSRKQSNGGHYFIQYTLSLTLIHVYLSKWGILNKDKILKKTEEKILNILVLTWFIISYTFSPNKKVVTDVIHI